MKTSLLIFLTLPLLLAACTTTTVDSTQRSPVSADAEPETPRYQNHPIVGIWAFTENGCTETYQFFVNGTRKGFSGSEMIDAVFTISEQPMANGFYLMQDRVVKDSGGVGCSGSDQNLTGSSVKVLVKFSRDKRSLTFCSAENNKQCFGPLQRQDGGL